MSSLGEGGEILPQSLVGLPGYVSLEAANHLSFAATFLESPSSVGACAFAVAQSLRLRSCEASNSLHDLRGGSTDGERLPDEAGVGSAPQR